MGDPRGDGRSGRDSIGHDEARIHRGVPATPLASSERVLRTPIPLGYTRYTIRFLWLWLTLLPFALSRTYADFGEASTWWEGKAQPVLVVTMLLIGFIFLSIEDIAVQIEEPFAILPLERLQQALERDVEQMRRLMRSADASRRERSTVEGDEAYEK